MIDETLLCKYWGKAKPQTTGTRWHPLIYHSFDVAAAGQVLLQQNDRLRFGLTRKLGLSDDQRFLRWITFFLAIHDLGKFSESFQILDPELFDELHGTSTKRDRSMRHDSLGFFFWEKKLRDIVQRENWFGFEGNRQTLRHFYRGVLGSLASAVTGHHGKPPSPANNAMLAHYFTPANQETALEFCRQVRAMFLPDETSTILPQVNDWASRGQHVSWWLVGLAVTADWVGSNQTFFPYTAPTIPLPDYWLLAQEKAAQALDQVGLLPSPAAAPKRFDQLYTKIAQPTPLQRAVSELSLDDGPQLFILEDVTGAGKTEAATMLAHRLMSGGVAHGIYVGLPTMATADAMYTRMADVYRALFAEGAKPSLILAHSARELSSDFRHSILPDMSDIESDYGPSEAETAGARCRAWLADNRKKALLAEIGVGTIDQALLAILYAKHQSLRLLGLLGKVLIVDEVHACDAYMHKLLQHLLEAHASLGGSAILLSATLPQTMRRELTQAFCAGAGIAAPTLQASGYPLLTYVGASQRGDIPLETRDIVKRRVAVEVLQDVDDVVRRMVQAVQMGKCVCWVRNTVADARDAFALLQARMAADKLHLFHARFAMGDRLALQDQVLGYVDQNSTSEDRWGRVVIATQVVEQSLDLDFDLMVSDLAPIDLIIQRAGRLCRHTRDVHGTRVNGPDQRGTPRLLVYGPVPDVGADGNWFARVFPRAVLVYPNHGQLWLTAKLLGEQGGFRMPEDARELIEGVYGKEAEAEMPEALQARYARVVVANDGVARSQADINRIKIQGGYKDQGETPCWEDAMTPTRLGEKRTTVQLARWDGEALAPWAEGPFAWQMSQVQIREELISAMVTPSGDPALQAQVEATLLTLPDRGKWSVLLPLRKGVDGRWQGEALNGRAERVTVYYDENLGLLMANEMGGAA